MTHNHVQATRLGAAAFKRRGVDADTVGLVPRKKTSLGGAREGAGRHAREGEPATTLVALRLTVTERAEWQAAAKAAGFASLSDFVRDAVKARLPKRKRG